MKHPFLHVTAWLSFLWFSIGVLPAAGQLRIVNASPSALPREVITLQGHFSPAAKIHLSRGANGTVLTPAVLVQSEGHASVAIPADLALDLYQVWVAEGGSRSPSVFINRARGMHYSSPEVIPGGAVRIFGRNLQLPGSTPRVRFVQQDNAASTEASVVAAGSDAYKLVISVPGTLLPGKTYDVYVTNGFGAALGETKVEQPLKVIPATANYFNLPVDWGHRFDYYGNSYNVKTDSRLTLKAIGDGVADDQAAIQQCIAKAAQAGGGVVYLPAGSYKLLARGLEIPSRVMLVGAGINQTFLRYGYAGDGLGIYLGPNTTTSGLADLSVENVSNDGTWKNNVRGNQVTEFVMQRVRLKLNKGWWLELADGNKISITNCEITQGVTSTTNYRGPIRLDGSKNIVFAHNTVTYAVDALNFGQTGKGGANNIVFENNTIYRDGSARWPTTAGVVSHVVTFNFAYNVANLNNTYKVINGDPQNINDGETIIAEQGGGYTPDESVGTVSGATATTLTDNTKAWGALVQPWAGVGIVHGKGMGQWRPISSRTATTLTLAEAWDVVPDASSRYSVYSWGARNWLVQGNTMEGNQRGITIYHNATKDIMIADNILTNNGSIDVTPWQKDINGATTVGFLPVYNVQIINNRVSDANGKMGVFIGVHPVQHIQPKAFGTSVVGFEVRNNNVTAYTPNAIALVDDKFPNGYLNYLEFHNNGQNYVNEGIPAIIGSIFQNNTATNCDKAMYLNTGSYNTLVCEMKLVNTPVPLDDSRLTGASHASVRTASCAAPASGNQLPAANPGADKVLVLPASSTTLAGAGTDPDGTIASYAWSQVGAAPAAATFSSKTVAAPTVSGLTVAGAYTFALVVTDNAGAQSPADQVTVTVSPAPAAGGQQVVSFTLINADSDLPLRTLVADDVLNLAALPTRNLSIRANTNPATVGSVKFALSGTQTRAHTETAAPYALFADAGGNYNPWTPAIAPGAYRLAATPYTGGGGGGAAGTALTLNFTVTNQTAARPATAAAGQAPRSAPAPAQAFPNPTRTGQFRLLLPDAFRGQPVAYALVSALGATLARGTLAPPDGGGALPLDLAQPMRATGLYYLLLTGKHAHARLKLIKE